MRWNTSSLESGKVSRLSWVWVKVLMVYFCDVVLFDAAAYVLDENFRHFIKSV